MPVGIIRDPKMNPNRERNYGIIWSADKSESYYYRKNEMDWTRYAYFGDVAEFEEDPKNPVEGPDAEDFEVRGTVRLIDPLDGDDLSPVYSRINARVTEDERREAINDAIKNGLDSDFESSKYMK